MSKNQLPSLYSLELGEVQRVLNAFAEAIENASNGGSSFSTAAGRTGAKLSAATPPASLPPVVATTDPSGGPTTEVTPTTPQPIPDPQTPTKTKGTTATSAQMSAQAQSSVTPQQVHDIEKVVANLVTSTDYSEDANGVPLTGFKLDNAEPTYKLKVGNGWFGTSIKIGASTYTLGVTAGRALTGIAASGSSATDVIWWRGNDDPSTNGGAPVIIDPLWALDRSPAWAVGDRVLSGPPSASAATYLNGRWVYECTTAGASLTTAQAGSAAWSSITTYAAGNTVTSSNRVYKSKQASNLNHAVSDTTWWQDMGLTYGITGTLRTTDIYSSGDAKFKCVGYMLTNVNSANSGCRGWIRSTAYVVGDLVVADVPSGSGFTSSYVGDNSKMYGNPSGVPNASGLVYGGTRVYRCTTAGTSAATGQGPTGTGTGITDGTAVWDYWAENTGPEDRIQIWHTNSAGEANSGALMYEVRVQPKTNKDNLDALTHIDIDVIDNASGWIHRGTLREQISVPVPSRKYYSSSTPAHIGNMVRASFIISSVNSNLNNYNAGAPYASYQQFQVALHNTHGSSATIPYKTWAAQNIQPVPYTNNLSSAPTGGGGGGGGGSSCPEPWVKILTERGEIRADEVVVGDVVITEEESLCKPGRWPVTAVSMETNETAMLTLRKTPASGEPSIIEVAFALNHRLLRGGMWVALRDIQCGAKLKSTDGSLLEVLSVDSRGVNDVVRITVDTAHTYSTSGLLSHNIKILD